MARPDGHRSRLRLSLSIPPQIIHFRFPTSRLVPFRVLMDGRHLFGIENGRTDVAQTARAGVACGDESALCCH